jgi:IS5 family transposase
LARRDEATCGASRRVFISGQKRGVFGVIKRELRRRSAIEAVNGHMKADGHLGRCYLKGRAGDAANAVLTAVGYNLRLILAWLRALLCLILTALTQAFTTRSVLKSAWFQSDRLRLMSVGSRTVNTDR